MTEFSDAFISLIGGSLGHQPISEYPWKERADRLIQWSLDKSNIHQAFAFDLLASLSFIDSLTSIGSRIESCPNAPKDYDSHIGFINMCGCCFMEKDIWKYQVAAKPQSGALGKITSELTIRFLELKYNNVVSALSIGGVGVCDAILLTEHTIILCEVKAAPVLTYPLLLKTGAVNGEHMQYSLTNSQLRDASSALYMYDKEPLCLGLVGSAHWPFANAVEYVCNIENSEIVERWVKSWSHALMAYAKRDKTSKHYYIANASGKPPRQAVIKDGWPPKESISDGKTSAGMDRTDDIKKGIYQAIKLGIEAYGLGDNHNYRTALIGNLPAFRHSEEYIKPFIDTYWGYEKDFYSAGVNDNVEALSIKKADLHRFFDYIITIVSPMVRNDEL